MDSLPNDDAADAASLVASTRSAATARAALHAPNRRVTTLAGGHSPPARRSKACPPRQSYAPAGGPEDMPPRYCAALRASRPVARERSSTSHGTERRWRAGKAGRLPRAGPHGSTLSVCARPGATVARPADPRGDALARDLDRPPRQGLSRDPRGSRQHARSPARRVGVRRPRLHAFRLAILHCGRYLRDASGCLTAARSFARLASGDEQELRRSWIETRIRARSRTGRRAAS
jgi:hypothetical protein